MAKKETKKEEEKSAFDLEAELEDYPLPVIIDETTQIINQLKKFLCKIENDKGKGTGFFCYIPYKNI